jgi:CubicO group peptidase (beta-lactamase class C family)
VTIDGHVARGFEAVSEAFAKVMSDPDESGAAFAAYHRGECVVDLWGGTADKVTRRPWTADTPVTIFSGTKGLVAACLLILVDRGLLDLDAAVAQYWPEYAASNKDGVLVRHLASHQGGQPDLPRRVDTQELLDDVAMANLLASAPSSWPAGSRLVYHGLTYGWLCGELIRRVSGRSVGRFFAEELAEPLQLDAWIGVPEQKLADVARLEYGAGWVTLPDQGDPSSGSTWRSNSDAFSDDIPWNERAWRLAEIPAGGGIATASSMAKLYGSLAAGEVAGTRRVISSEVIELGAQPLATGTDELLGTPLSFGVGFELNTSLHPLGPVTGAFGHTGAGGSAHGAWPEFGVGFSYAMNSLRNDALNDPRSSALLKSLHKCVSSSRV